jgi:hypothetical protein
MTMATERRPRAIGWALFAALLSVYWLTNSGFDVTEGLDDLCLAGHLLQTRTLGFERDPGGISAAGPDGRFYMSHDVGNAVALLPAAFAGRLVAGHGAEGAGRRCSDRLTVFAASFMPGLFMALAALGVYEAVLAATAFGSRTAALTALAFGAGTMAWPYSRLLFDGGLAALFLIWASALLFRIERAPDRRRAALAGVLFGAAVATRQVMIVVLPAAVAYVWWVGRARGARSIAGDLACVVVPVAVCLAWQGYYNWLRTGSPVYPPTALPVYAANNTLDGNTLRGLIGLLISPGKSMLLFSPVLALSLIAIPTSMKTRPAVSSYILCASACFLVLHATVRNWSGDWGWGPRYTLTITPLLCVLAAWPVHSLSRLSRRSPAFVAAASLGVFAVAVQLVAVIINWHYRYAFLFEIGAWSRDRMAWSLPHGQFVDAFVTAGRNLGRICGTGLRVDVVTGADSLNVLASNGINVWWLTAPLAGVPWAVTIPAAIGLATLCIVALRTLARLGSKRVHMVIPS